MGINVFLGCHKAMLTKKQIRSKIFLRLKTQKEENRDRKSKLIKKKLFRDLVFKKAKRVMFYLSFDGEVTTDDMIKEAQKQGKIVAVPVCKKDRMMKPARLEDKARLVKGLYGIRQPLVKKFMRPKELGLVIVPGVAFDRKGNRLGRGKGYYDRFLKKIPHDTPTLGLAFDFQILPFIPATKTDVSVKKVISA
jgi:5-formyltetrahydrofolate cyclo-ligase